MARSTRGLPGNFALDLPEEGPVQIGDFLDETPLAPPRPRVAAPVQQREPEIELEVVVTARRAGEALPIRSPRPARPDIIRYQLNLTPRCKQMLEELVEFVQAYSQQNDARTSEVFQGIMTLLHGAMNELDLSDVPRRGAWGSVTARNFPSALSEVFERAIVTESRKRGRS